MEANRGKSEFPDPMILPNWGHEVGRIMFFFTLPHYRAGADQPSGLARHNLFRDKWLGKIHRQINADLRFLWECCQ